MSLVDRCTVCDAKLPNQYGGGPSCGGVECARYPRKGKAMTYKQDVPLYVIDPTAEEGALVVHFEWTPGREATGLSGPPENYDPGEADEFTITDSRYDVDFPHKVGLADHEMDAVIEWLDQHWERPVEEHDDRLDQPEEGIFDDRAD